MKKLNITKERFEKSRYFQKKYGTLEYVNESGKVFKTSKGKLLKFKESVDWEDDPEYYGDGRLHVFDYGEDYPFKEQYVVMFPSGSVLYTSPGGYVSYWDDQDTMSYSTMEEMEDNFTAHDGEDEYVPTEVSDLTSLPRDLKDVIRSAARETGYDIDKDVEEFL